MRNRGWSAVALATVMAVMAFTASCTKKAVRTQTQTQAQPQVQAQAPTPAQARPESMTAPEARKAPDSSTEKAGQAGRTEDDRLRAEAAAREAAQWVFVNEHVHFAFGSSLLSDQARQILNGKAGYLRTNPGIKVTVEGHCDDRGTNAYNVALGERRAESVKTFLVDLGIGTNRLNTVSFGEERPVAMGHNETSWAKNRRAQFVIN